MTEETGLYLDIPFCVSKCAYCDFPSYAGKLHLAERVVEKMLSELEKRSSALGAREVSTVYVGGGTPSLLAPGLFTALLDRARACFPFRPDAEVTVEMNPGTLTDAFLEAAAAAGVNRVSLGVQSADDRLLSMLGRIHRFSDAVSAVSQLKNAGLDNISLDMMIGLPGQSLDDVRDTLTALIGLGPGHLSCYGLIPEEGTPLYERLRTGQWVLPDEDIERDMYELARRMLADAGFEQYEISNFARPGRRCRHNVNCWRRQEYVGIGVSAAGFIGRTRYRNPLTIEGYLADEPPETTELTPEDERFESVMLGLRLTEGVSDAGFAARHGMSIGEAFGGKLTRPIRDGLLTYSGGRLCLTRRGMDLQNAVLVELL